MKRKTIIATALIGISVSLLNSSCVGGGTTEKITEFDTPILVELQPDEQSEYVISRVAAFDNSHMSEEDIEQYRYIDGLNTVEVVLENGKTFRFAWIREQPEINDILEADFIYEGLIAKDSTSYTDSDSGVFIEPAIADAEQWYADNKSGYTQDEHYRAKAVHCIKAYMIDNMHDWDTPIYVVYTDRGHRLQIQPEQGRQGDERVKLSAGGFEVEYSFDAEGKAAVHNLKQIQ